MQHESYPSIFDGPHGTVSIGISAGDARLTVVTEPEPDQADWAWVSSLIRRPGIGRLHPVGQDEAPILLYIFEAVGIPSVLAGLEDELDAAGTATAVWASSTERARGVPARCGPSVMPGPEWPREACGVSHRAPFPASWVAG